MACGAERSGVETLKIAGAIADIRLMACSGAMTALLPCAGGLLNNNVDLLRHRVNRHTVLGLCIAVAALGLATLLVCYLSTGTVTVAGLLEAQRTNYALWLMDIVPFAFAIVGQYSGMRLAHQAGAMVVDQTSELHAQASELERKVAYEATHDALTELPNRVLLYDRVKQAILRAERTEESVAVLLLDLDRFKEINDTLGHYNGDRLLRQVASRLEGVVHEPNSVARLGGDEFAILLVDPVDVTNIDGYAARLKKAIEPPFALDHLNFEVDASVGGARFPAHGKDPDALLQRADIAMHAAKEAHSGYVAYHRGLDRYNPRRLTMMGELRSAIAADGLELHYQPKIDMASGRICGVEALVRWQQADDFVPPDEFIPLAERTRLIKPLTSWVLRTALAQASQWRRGGYPIDVAINLSARDLHDPQIARHLRGSHGGVRSRSLLGGAGDHREHHHGG